MRTPLSFFSRIPTLLGMALILTLSVGLVACDDDRPVDTTTTDTTADPYAADPTYDDGAITSPAMLMDAPNAPELDGRDVRFMNVRVVEVLGDSAMYVAAGNAMANEMDPAAPSDPTTLSGTGERVLVMRDQGLWSDLTGQDTLDEEIRAGLMVDIEGNVRMWDADDAGATTAAPMTVGSLYVEASRIDRHDRTRTGTNTETTTPGSATGAMNPDASY